MNALQYANSVAGLLTLPENYLEIKSLMDSDTATLTEIADVILKDPVLTSRVLQLANSALYNLSYQVSSVEKALLVLGRKQIYNLLLSIGIGQTYSQIKTDAIDLTRVWELSVNAALIAQYLATECKLKDPDVFYVSGLLHNIGELVVLQVAPDIACRCQQYNKHQSPWQLQKKYLGFTYAECGAELLSHWQIPDQIVTPIALQHNRHFTTASVEQLVIYLAARLALINQHLDMYSVKTLIDPFVYEKLQLTLPDLLKALNFCNTEGLFVLSVLNPKISPIY